MDGGFRLALACGAAWLMLVHPGEAQTFRLGSFDLFLTGKAEVGYDSNVDDNYPEEVDPDFQQGDFYWMPGLTLRSGSVPMRPSTTVNLLAGIAYQDYFVRNDLDTELWNANLRFQTAHPRLTLGGGVGSEYTVEANQEKYYPGGASYDPRRTDLAELLASWKYRALRLEASANYSSERHYYEKYQPDDQDETILMAGAYWSPINKLNLFYTWKNTETILIETDEEENETVSTWNADLRLFQWGGLFYTRERTVTTTQPSGDETEETKNTFGISGSMPASFIPHPKITYSLAIQYEETENTTGEVEETWEPVHTITVSDELQISKTVLLSGNATWNNDVDADDVEFQYNLSLAQKIGARAQHVLTFTQEPEPTFGSTTDTKSTTYSYAFSVNDLIFYNLSMRIEALYEEETPLDEEDALTEGTTTLTFGLNHTRQLSRKLSRVLAYVYTWENSNFHDYGAKEKYLLTYGLAYEF